MKKLFLFVMAAMCAASMWANMAAPGLFRMEKQPDGTEVKVFIHGDEWFNYETDSLGYVFERDTNGHLKRDARGFLINTHKKMTAEYAQQQRIASRKALGQGPHKIISTPHEIPRILVLLVDFPDTTFHEGNDKQAWVDFFNKEGYDFEGATGSVRDYFIAQSGGKYKPQFDVYGPVTVEHEWKYYDYATQQSFANVYEIAPYALEQLDDQIDYTQYDTDDDGNIDLIYIVYAGYSYSTDGKGIWPHHHTEMSLVHQFDGKYYAEYSCTGEMRSKRKRAGIGTFCHEFSHALGFPDYYDTDHSSNGSNLEVPGYWALMCEGDHLDRGRTPPGYSIYDKYYMGWETPKVLKDFEQITLKPSQSGYMVTKNGKLQPYNFTDTVYYVENRQNKGFDRNAPGHGLLVWRVVYDQDNWTHNDVNHESGTTGMTLVASSGRTEYYGNYEAFTQGGTNDGITTDNLDAFPGDNYTTSVNLFEHRLSKITENSDGTVTFVTGEIDVSLRAEPESGGQTYKDASIEGGETVEFRVDIDGCDITTDATIEWQYCRQYQDGGADKNYTTFKWNTSSQVDPLINALTFWTNDKTDKYNNCSSVSYRVKVTINVDGKKHVFYSNIINIYFKYKLKFVLANGDVDEPRMVIPGEKNILLSDHESSCYSYEVKSAQKANVYVKDGKVYLEEMPCANVTVYTRDGAVKYYVYFFDYDGTILKTQLVACGEDATPPANPSYKGMEFVQWNGNYTEVHATTCVYAQYKAGTGHFADIELSEHTCPGLDIFTEPDYRDEFFKGSDKIALSGDLLTFRFTQQAEDGGTAYFQSTQLFDDETGDPKFSGMTEIGKLTKEEALAKKDLFYTYDFCHNPPFCDSEKQFVYKMAFRFAYNSGGATYYSDPMVFDIYYPLVFRFKKDDGIKGVLKVNGVDNTFTNDMSQLKEQGEYVYTWIPARFQENVFYSFANTAYRDISDCLDMTRLRFPKIWPDVDRDIDKEGNRYLIEDGFIDTIAVTKQSFHVEFSYYVKDGEGKEWIQDEQTVACGEAAVEPSHEDMYLPFAGWFLNGKIDEEQRWLNVTEEMHFKADYVYPPDPVYYTVTFADKDGNVIKTESVKQFDDATPPSVVPTFEGWHFIGWNASYTYVTANIYIRAIYGQDDVYWKVNYYNWNGDWLGEESVQDGHAARGEGIYPYQTGHKFIGWSIMPLNEIHKDMTVTAIFDETEVPTHKVTILHENGTVTVQPNSVDLDKVNEGTILSLTAVPDEGCEFRGWENYDVERGVTVFEDITITAKFVRVKAVTYTVEFFDKSGNVLLKSEEVEEGKTATAPDAPAEAGFTFIGWQQQSGLFELLTAEQVNALPVTEDMMYKATYKEKSGTDIDQIVNRQSSNRKLLIEGHLFILVGDRIYDATGKKVK